MVVMKKKYRVYCFLENCLFLIILILFKLRIMFNYGCKKVVYLNENLVIIYNFLFKQLGFYDI